MGRITVVNINTATATPISVKGETRIGCNLSGFYVAYNETEAQDGTLMRRILYNPTSALLHSFDAGEGYTLWIVAATANTTLDVWTDIGQGSITGGY